MNKNVKILMALMSLVIISLMSCKKEKDNPEVVNAIIAKWEITDPNSPYTCFEFTKDSNYIVIRRNEVAVDGNKTLKSNANSKSSWLMSAANAQAKASKALPESNLSPVHFGKYKIDGDKIILSGFGVINVIKITKEEFAFSFKLESTGDEWNYVANKVENLISSSSKTDMLCRTWVLDKVTLSIDESELTELEKTFLLMIKALLEGSTVVFSQAGTYLVMYPMGFAGLAEWKWANKEETAFYFSWDNWESSDIALINKLTSTSLEIKEETEEGYYSISKLSISK